MQITEQAWAEYVRKLAQLDEEVYAKMAHYIDIFGTDNPDNHLVTYAQALIEKYGAGSAELACQMYDELARLSGVDVPRRYLPNQHPTVKRPKWCGPRYTAPRCCGAASAAW